MTGTKSPHEISGQNPRITSQISHTQMKVKLLLVDFSKIGFQNLGGFVPVLDAYPGQ